MNNGLPLYASSAGASGSFVGSLTAICSLTAVIGRLASGVLSDSWGRRPLLVFGAGAILLLFVPMIFIRSLAVLPLLMALFGIFWSTVTTASSAAAADQLSNERMGEGMGLYSLGQAIAMAVGPALAAKLLGIGGSPLMFSGIAAVSALSLVLSISCRNMPFVPRPKEKRERLKLTELIYKAAIPLSLAMLFFRVSAALMLSFISMYAESERIPNSELFFIVEAGAMVLTRLSTGKLIDRYKPNFVFVPTIIVGALSFFVLCGKGSFALLMVSAVLYGLSLGTAQPLVNALIMRKADPSHYGRATSTYILFMDVGTALGAMLWGKLLDLSSGSYPLIFAGGGVFLLLCGAVGVAANIKDSRK